MPFLPEETMFYKKNYKGEEKEQHYFLGEVKKITICENALDFHGVCRKATAVRKGTALLYSP